MMKNIFKTVLALLVLSALLATLAGCKEKSIKSTALETEPEATEFTELTDAEAALSLLRENVEMSGDLCGVAYLGGFFGEFPEFADFLTDNGILERFPFLENLPEKRFIATGGWDVYLVIPRDAAVDVAVHEWVMDESNDYMGAAGALLYEGEAGEPFVLCCNVSDIMPDTRISLSDGEDRAEYNPGLSLENGKLWIPEDAPVLDISPYEEQYWFCGAWEGYICPDDGRESNVIYIEFYEDGSLFYAYGPYDDNGSRLTNSYEGMWYSADDEFYPDGSLSVNLWLLEGEEGCPTELHSIQFPHPSGLNEGAMILYTVEGDWLTPNEYEFGFELWPT